MEESKENNLNKSLINDLIEKNIYKKYSSFFIQDIYKSDNNKIRNFSFDYTNNKLKY